MNHTDINYLGAKLDIGWLGIAGDEVEIMTIVCGGQDVLGMLECMRTKDGSVINELTQLIHQKEAR
jgi:hypothetical protein